MNHHYEDIRSRISEPPTWFDENAVPRYGEFEPNGGADIYADEVALVAIECQNCGEPFTVAISRKRSDLRRIMGGEEYVSIADDIRSGRLHYGDPPNTDCCPAGPTMNCEDLRVLQYWKREGFDWTRDPSLEIGLGGQGEAR